MQLSREDVEIFSEHTELLSEDRRGSAVQLSAETLRMSSVMVLHSSMICSLWMLELGDRER